MLHLEELKNRCTNNCGTVEDNDLKFIDGKPYCPFCYMSGGKDYKLINVNEHVKS